MDTETLVYYKYIKTLDKVSNDDIEQHKELIQLFNEYVSSNRNFKYNKTYLNDSISGFLDICKTFQHRKQIVWKFSKNIKEHYESLKNWYIVIDHLFLIENNQVVLIFDELKENASISFTKKAILENELRIFNLYGMDKNNIVIKYYLESDSDNIEYTEKYNVKEEIKINSLVKNDLTERVMQVENSGK